MLSNNYFSVMNLIILCIQSTSSSVSDKLEEVFKRKLKVHTKPFVMWDVKRASSHWSTGIGLSAYTQTLLELVGENLHSLLVKTSNLQQLKTFRQETGDISDRIINTRHTCSFKVMFYFWASLSEPHICASWMLKLSIANNDVFCVLHVHHFVKVEQSAAISGWSYIL